jgi:hypothetical protein
MYTFVFLWTPALCEGLTTAEVAKVRGFLPRFLLFVCVRQMIVVFVWAARVVCPGLFCSDSFCGCVFPFSLFSFFSGAIRFNFFNVYGYDHGWF